MRPWRLDAMAVCERLGIPSVERMGQPPWCMTSRELTEWLGYFEFQRNADKYRAMRPKQTPQEMRDQLRLAIDFANAKRRNPNNRD